MPPNQPVNRELVEARIREINDALQTLNTLTCKDFKTLVLVELLALRYLVIQLVEAAASICINLLAARFNERAEGFPDCFTRLSVKGLITESLALALAGAARLRNLLVHRYWDINDEQLYLSAKTGGADFLASVDKVRIILEEGT